MPRFPSLRTALPTHSLPLHLACAEVVARRDNTGPLIAALGGRVGQGALSTGYGQASGQAARASVGGLTTVTPAGTGTESVTAASVGGASTGRMGGG